MLTLHHAVQKAMLLLSVCPFPISAPLFTGQKGGLPFHVALACIASPVTALHEVNVSRSSRFRRPSKLAAMPSQHTSLKTRSVLAGKAARPLSLTLGQELILKVSKAGCCPSTCTSWSSVMSDLHRTSSKPECRRPLAVKTSQEYILWMQAQHIDLTANRSRGACIKD